MRVIVSGRRARGLGGLNRKVLFYAMGAVREHVGGVYLMGTLGANLVCLGMEFARRKLGNKIQLPISLALRSNSSEDKLRHDWAMLKMTKI